VAHLKRFVVVLFLSIFSLPALASDVVLQGQVKYSPGSGMIGVRVAPSGRVARVRPGSPADRCGISPGDKIVCVDGRSDVVGRIHGMPGTTVLLTIKRGEEEFVREVERVNEHTLLPYNGVAAAPEVIQ
jgi:C-terminal processing protease CtpA/Prc